MRSFFYCLVIVVALAPTLGVSARTDEAYIDDSTDELIIEDVVRQFVDAWNRDDADALSLLFTPNGTFTSPRGTRARGRQDIRKLLAHEHQEIFIGTSLSKTVRTITFPNADMAVVSGKYTLSGLKVFLGFTTSVKGTFALRLVRKSNWLIEEARISSMKG